jgi:imidazolonepropionase-like amidohydrolase
MRVSLLLLLLLSGSIASAQLLIKNVTVADVEKKKLLPGYTVLVQEGKIAVLDKNRQYKLPEGTTILDGTGKYLVPGLSDAHIHFFQDGGLHARPDAIDLRKYRPYSEEIKWTHAQMGDLLRRYLSVGITAVTDVGASNNFLAQRDSFAAKEWAPHINMTGPLLTTYIPAPYKELGEDAPFILMVTEEGVRTSVQQQIALHTDFIKIWYIVQDADIEKGALKNLPLVKAAIDEAHKNNKRVAVHATELITAKMAVEAGADFLVHSVEDAIVTDEFVQLLKKNKTVLSPTLVVAGNYGKVLGDYYPFTTDELQIANPETIASVIDYPFPDTTLAARYIKRMQLPAVKAGEAKADSIMQVNLKKLLAAGVTIATGTDAGNIGTQHASSYFAELKAMQQAGCTMWQLLEAATINGAKAMGQEKEWGSIAVGKQANLLLLSANPLDSLTNWRKIDWVINKGVALRPDAIVINTPVQLVQQQLNAYNAHDLEAFLAPYADDAELYEFPDKLVGKGKEQMRKDYQFITRIPTLYCELQNRVVEGNMVIDHEKVTGFGGKPVTAVAIYIIEAGKIKKVYFK